MAEAEASCENDGVAESRGKSLKADALRERVLVAFEQLEGRHLAPAMAESEVGRPFGLILVGAGEPHTVAVPSFLNSEQSCR